MFGLTPFETLLAVWAALTTISRGLEWFFNRSADDRIKHWVNNLLDTRFVRKEIYERDWKETDRRLRDLQQRETAT